MKKKKIVDALIPLVNHSLDCNKKLKAGVFYDPQIRKLINNLNCSKSMSSVKASTWSFSGSAIKKKLFRKLYSR